VKIEKLKPCPFCGSEEIVAKDHHGNGISYVECVECGTLGPYSNTVEDAIKWWNRRAK
jgi:Lar family restriction alleviation protein